MSDKAPIYPVEVIEVACRALEAIDKFTPDGDEEETHVGCIVNTALRIISDGLASHEKAIRGET